MGVAEIQDEDDMSDGARMILYGFHIRLPLVWREALILTATPFTVADTDDADEAKTLIENFLFEIFKDDDYYRVSA